MVAKRSYFEQQCVECIALEFTEPDIPIKPEVIWEFSKTHLGLDIRA